LLFEQDENGIGKFASLGLRGKWMRDEALLVCFSYAFEPLLKIG